MTGRSQPGGMPSMTLKRFQHLLLAYGTDIGRWPPAEQHAARALLASSREAVAAHGAAAPLDNALHQVRPQVSPASVARVLAAVRQPPAPPAAIPAPAAARHPAATRWLPPALLGGIAMLGLLVRL